MLQRQISDILIVYWDYVFLNCSQPLCPPGVLIGYAHQQTRGEHVTSPVTDTKCSLLSTKYIPTGKSRNFGSWTFLYQMPYRELPLFSDPNLLYVRPSTMLTTAMLLCQCEHLNAMLTDGMYVTLITKVLTWLTVLSYVCLFKSKS